MVLNELLISISKDKNYNKLAVTISTGYIWDFRIRHPSFYEIE
jgi:hypothetical protein